MPIALKLTDAEVLIEQLEAARRELERVQESAFDLAAELSTPNCQIQAVFWSNPFSGSIDSASIWPKPGAPFDPKELPLGLVKLKSRKTITVEKMTKKQRSEDPQRAAAVDAWHRRKARIQPNPDLSGAKFLQDSGLPESADRTDSSTGTSWHCFPDVFWLGTTVYALFERGEFRKPPTGRWEAIRMSEFYTAKEAADV